jgi:hypothetical protein
MAEINSLTVPRLRELLTYEAETGTFLWNVNRRGHARAGDVAGHDRGDGYFVVKIDQKNYYHHRLAWFYVNGIWPTQTIDHINGKPSDNRIANLRDVSPRINSENQRSPKSRTVSGTLMGAYWCRTWKRWKSSIQAHGKQWHIGWFDTEQQAHDAYIAAKRLYHEGCTL